MKNTTPMVSNFCTSVRDAIALIGCSSEMARGVVNSELGQLKKTKEGEAKTGDIKVKIPKNEANAPTASVSVKLGSEKYEGKLTTAVLFAAYNDANKECERLNPSHAISIDKEGMFGKWLVKVATPKADEVPA